MSSECWVGVAGLSCLSGILTTEHRSPSRTFTFLFSTLAQASSLHIDVAAYYDTPVISLRDVLLPRILNDPTSNPAPGGVLGPEGQVGLEVKKWFRNVPEEERIEGDAKVVDGVDLMHVSWVARGGAGR